MRQTRALLAELHAAGELDLPRPGDGQTVERNLALFRLARSHPLDVARLAEGHLDAVAIADELRHDLAPGALYGVWASEAGPPLRYAPRDGRLEGEKWFCSGAPLLDRALVSAHDDDRRWLLDVPLGEGVRWDATTWATPALADSATATVHFGVTLGEGCRVGAPGAYLERSGFWQGALGPAACWAGGAAGLVDMALERSHRQDPHTLASLGALDAAGWTLRALIVEASRDLDRGRDPQTVALRARHAIERRCTEVLDLFGRATGPHLLAFDAEVAQRHAALTLYLRQCHGARDLEALIRRRRSL
ncbi:MAG: hypothetical protein CMN30_13765 [Sandaracinus sp.]|nr:hypothetical protein [Sandaracinus sp.]